MLTKVIPMIAGEHHDRIVRQTEPLEGIQHAADLGMLLARTDPDKPKHKGIAWFAFPMLQDGVDVRPLREMTGRAMASPSQILF